jgi:hypothetical protein
MNPFKRTYSMLKLDAAAQAVGQGTLRALSPIERLSAIAGVAGLVLRLFRRQDALEGSPKDPRRNRPASPTGRTKPKPAGGRQSGGRRRATNNPQPLTSRSAA